MNLSQAVKHYRELKEAFRREEPELLDWYESGRSDWRYDVISFDNFLSLLYRTIWTSGFRSQTVFDKEEDYFIILKKHLYPDGVYSPNGRDRFLKDVATVLGGRKNKYLAACIEIIEKMEWEVFRRDYLHPRPDVMERLGELLPGVGPTTVKILVNQTGIRDIPKDDIWLIRFAKRHGFTDVFDCVKQISSECGDDQTTIDAVVYWAGRTYDLQVP